ncbi:ApbE family lipoprotein [Mesorhizobium sp. ORS 3324]|nr:ApbE family lipoprotein [Mesorhizobium sp. ORS 3324]
MMNGPQAHWLADGRRLHLNHGPIDLIVEAFGDPDECRAAYAQAVARFQTILTQLVEELPELRRPASLKPRAFAGPTARRMEAAVAPLAESFITPMAAVAGSVADEILAALLAGRRLDRAYVNNGGDSAIHLDKGQSMTLAIAGTGHGMADRIAIRAEDGVRGVATSGWRGRSFSLGIADAVTVLARTGAEADAAATLIANAVDLPGHPTIRRVPAHDLAPDSDLGERLVTQGVGPLVPEEAARALDNGLAVAEEFRRRGLIAASALFLAGQSRVSGSVALAAPNKHKAKETAHA